MGKRPITVAIVSWVFVFAGGLGFLGCLLQIVQLLHSPAQMGRITLPELGLVCFVRLLAVVGGVFMLWRANWARWLCILWLAYHVVLSLWHSRFELIVHAILLILVGYTLLRPGAAAYFRNAK